MKQRHFYITEILIPASFIFLMGACAMPKGPVPLSGEVPEAEGWDTETVIDGLELPWAVAWLPENSDTMLITEKTGQLRVAVNDILWKKL